MYGTSSRTLSNDRLDPTKVFDKVLDKVLDRVCCGAATPSSLRSLRRSVGAYGAHIAKEFAMLVVVDLFAGARASSPAELAICSATPAGQDARSPALRRSRPFLAAKSAKKRRRLRSAHREGICDDGS